MKKAYKKPSVQYIDFYSKESITGISLEEGIALSSNPSIDAGISGSVGSGYIPGLLPD